MRKDGNTWQMTCCKEAAEKLAELVKCNSRPPENSKMEYMVQG
jgi:hypothetical protein